MSAFTYKYDLSVPERRTTLPQSDVDIITSRINRLVVKSGSSVTVASKKRNGKRAFYRKAIMRKALKNR